MYTSLVGAKDGGFSQVLIDDSLNRSPVNNSVSHTKLTEILTTDSGMLYAEHQSSK